MAETKKVPVVAKKAPVNNELPAKPLPIMILPETKVFLDGLKVQIKNIYNVDLKDNNAIILFLINNYYKK